MPNSKLCASQSLGRCSRAHDTASARGPQACRCLSSVGGTRRREAADRPPAASLPLPRHEIPGCRALRPTPPSPSLPTADVQRAGPATTGLSTSIPHGSPSSREKRGLLYPFVHNDKVYKCTCSEECCFIFPKKGILCVRPHKDKCLLNGEYRVTANNSPTAQIKIDMSISERL